MKRIGIRKKHTFFFVLLLISLGRLPAQEEEVYEDDIIRKNNKVYYEGRPLTGWLLSNESGINNACDCLFKAHYKNGKLHGVKKEWYRSGRLKYSGQYYKGYKVGTHTYYYPNGRVKLIEKYGKNGIVHRIYYNPDGSKKKYEKWKGRKLIFNAPCSEDIEDCIAHFAAQKNAETSSQEQEESQASPPPAKPAKKEDLILLASDTAEITPPPLAQGRQVILYPNRQPKHIIYYEQYRPVIDSVFNKYGRLESILLYNDGKLTKEERYNADRKIIAELFYENDLLHGAQKYYTDEGKLKEVALYEYGKPVKRTFYHEDGTTIRSVLHYKDGLKHGEEKIYDTDGQLEKIRIYSHDRLTVEKAYEDGTLAWAKKFHPNGRTAEKIFYYANGRIKKKAVYNPEGQKTEITNFGPDGNPVSQTLYRDNEKIKIQFDDEGLKDIERAYAGDKLIREGRYMNNKREGIWKFYFPEKGFVIERRYKNGEMTGEKKIYLKRQIKNLPLDNAHKIVAYQTKELNARPRYYLVEYKFITDPLSAFNIDYELRQKWDMFFNQPEHGIRLVENTDPIKDEMIEGKIAIDSVQYRFYPQSKKENNKNYRLALRFMLKCGRYKGDSLLTYARKEYILPQSLGAMMFMSRNKAVAEILNQIDINPYLKTICLPKKGSLLKIQSKSGETVRSVVSSLSRNYVERFENFYIYDKDNPARHARLRVEIINGPQSILKVLDNGAWLYQYLYTKEPHPVITNEPPESYIKTHKL